MSVIPTLRSHFNLSTIDYLQKTSTRNRHPKMSNYINTLSNASAFTPEVQSAASALAPSKDALQAAIDTAIAAPESEDTLTGEQADLLKKGFEYATQVVKMLGGDPNTDEKLDVSPSFLHGSGIYSLSLGTSMLMLYSCTSTSSVRMTRLRLSLRCGNSRFVASVFYFNCGRDN